VRISSDRCVYASNGRLRKAKEVIRMSAQIRAGAVFRVAHPLHRQIYPLSNWESEEMNRVAADRRAIKIATKTAAFAVAQAISKVVDDAQLEAQRQESEEAAEAFARSQAECDADADEQADDEGAPVSSAEQSAKVCTGATMASISTTPTPDQVRAFDDTCSEATRLLLLAGVLGVDKPPGARGMLLGRSNGEVPDGLAASVLPHVRQSITGGMGTPRCTIRAIVADIPASVRGSADDTEVNVAASKAAAYVFNNPIAFLYVRSRGDACDGEEVFRCPTCSATNSNSVSNSSPLCKGCAYTRKVIRKRTISSPDKLKIASLVSNRSLAAECKRLHEQLEVEKLSGEAKDKVIEYQKLVIAELEEQIDVMMKTGTIRVVGVKDDDEANAAFATITAAGRARGEDGKLLLDEALPPGSAGRSMWDVNARNLESRLRTGTATGARYSTEIHSLALLVLARCGTTCYDKLAKELPCLPSSRTLRRFKGNLPIDEQGCLLSQWETLDLFMRKLSLREDEGWDRTGIVSFDEQYTAKYVEWNPATSRITGIVDEPPALSVIRHELELELSKAAPTADGASTDEREVFATRHIAFFWTSLGGIQTADGDAVAIQVARWASAGPAADRLVDHIRDVIRAGHAYGFTTAGVSCDNAGENASVLNHLMRGDGFNADHFIPASMKNKYPGVDFSQFVAFRDDTTGEPVFVLPDAPHILKCIRNALDSSGKGDRVKLPKVRPDGLQKEAAGENTRDVKQPMDGVAAGATFDQRFQVMNLRMLEEVVLWCDKTPAVAGKHRLLTHRLGPEHFHLTNSSKMRVRLAAGVLSNTMHRLIGDYMQYCDRPCTKDARNLPSPKAYASLQKFVGVVDSWFDVTNTAVHKNCGPIRLTGDGNGHEQLCTLLDTVQYFADWKNSLEKAGLSVKEQKCSFITDQTWCALSTLCLAEVAMCHYFLTDKPNRCIVLRRAQSDICEHHFGSRRTLQRGVLGKGTVGGNLRADQVAGSRRTQQLVSSKANSSVRTVGYSRP
jgi:hypothetical protein